MFSIQNEIHAEYTHQESKVWNHYMTFRDLVEKHFNKIKLVEDYAKMMHNEISDLLGFDKPANMTKFFKRYEGVSPKEFRKQHEF